MKKFKHLYKKNRQPFEKEVTQAYIEKMFDIDEFNEDDSETLESFLILSEKNDFWSNGVETFICL